MADEARAKRAAALEEKKRRLEALKARRSTRATAGGGGESADQPGAGASSGGGNLDEYIDGLLKSKAPDAPKTAEEEAAAVTAETPAPAAAAAPAATESVQVIAEPAPAPVAPPARQVETFTCGTQTLNDDFPRSAEEDEEEERKKKEEGEKRKKEEEEEKKDDGEGGDLLGAPSSPVKPLSTDEVESTVHSVPFSKFLNSASKRMERLLGAPVLADLLVDADYAGETDAEAEEAGERDRRVREAKERGGARGSDLVRASVTFECARWTSGRDCTDVDWSPVHRELMLASYHAPHMSAEGDSGGAAPGGGAGAAVRGISPDDTPSSSLVPRSGELQSDGLALVWSLAMPTRPEHIFTCGSPVLAGRFHPTEHHLVVGGCQSGQVVVWDIRAGRLPVQRSSMAMGSGSELKGHAHPICSMEVVEGGSGLVTSATDGRINFWSLANLRDPAESLNIGGPISCLSVAPESGTLACGDEGGGLHAVLTSADASSAGASSSSSSSRRTIRRIDPGSLDSSEEGKGESPGTGHFGVITSVATKVPPRSGGHISRGFLRGSSGMVLTTGVDWTTRVWAPAYKDTPLLTLLSHSYDYMCDAQWSPVHPSVFATASSDGTLGLWNLSASLDEPLSGTEGIVVDGAPDSSSARGLNKIRWSHDGRRIAAAAADRLHVLSMSDEVSRPKVDDEAKMMSNFTSRGMLDEL
eukprot:CAMPEP_0113581846 /NCGR_PEP_ID=MMETSP0015_2-20120614/31551_1 /TAXON_ID=2838 /ORGANISM="Odontella" /LENGTH=697 /DNA_ID=CAMNT_0000486383 /DNA_START=247 /DNA_END=2340 /DNA_ORIENTATION=+ /assembly_acc=CAM_ASM_000160